MSDSPSPEEQSQNVLTGNEIGRDLTTGDISLSNTINIYQIFNLPDKDRTKLTTITWREVCRQMLAKHPLRQHATEEDCELDIHVPLGLMERKQQQRRPANQDLPMEEVYKLEEKEEITRQFEHTQFLEHIGLGNNQAGSTKNTAIIGEPGAGKSTLLEKIAKEIDAQDKDLPICISLANLEGLTIEEYLEQKWLKDALLIIQQQLAPQVELSVRNVPEELKEALAKQFTNTQQGQIWLILDGLDEMKANSPTEALTIIEKQIGSGYLAKARIVLSCRTNVWDANLTNPFSKFDIYKTLEFKDSQRDDFIQQWFNKLNKSQLGTDLITKLKETGQERICELVKNPLRLVLLCRIWTLNQGQLPETKAEFYQRYLPSFYNWKKNIRDLTRQSSKRTELHQALGSLAIEAIKSGSKYRLKESLAREKMGEELFELAEALGWLNIVDRDLATDEAVYAFFHPTFQEYFAACAIDDWDFFLPCDHMDKPVKGKKYRIFEPKWKEVILLWLGREKIAKKEKEKFIDALVDFEDGCSPVKFESIDRGFYQYRAYFLAAAGINEFKEFSRTKEIVEKIIEWVFGNIISDIKTSAKTALTETNRVEAIAVLVNLLNSTSEEDVLWEAAKNLGDIGVGNEKAIAVSVNLLNSTNDKNVLRNAGDILGKIAIGNEKAIARLVDLIYSTSDENVLWQAGDILGKIAIGNKKAIADLVDLIYSTNNENVLWQAGDILGYISAENEKVIAALVDLIYSTSSEYVLWHTTLSLRKIGVGNEKAIAALVDLTNSTNNEHFLFLAGDSLGKIDSGNKIAIATLVKLIESTSNQGIRENAVASLKEIDSEKKDLISALANLINSTSNGSVLRKAVASLEGIGVGNETAIMALVNLINSTSDESVLNQSAESLGNIGVGNEDAIMALVNLINSTSDESVLWTVAESLEKIDSGNENGFAVLVKLINSTNDEQVRIRAAESLEKINSGNQDAIATLVNLIESTNDEFVPWQAVGSLGNIGARNEEGIAALIKVIESISNESVRIFAAESLGNIDPGNRKAIAALIKVIESTSDESVRIFAAESLGNIDPGNRKAIAALIKVIESTSDESVRRRAIEILGKILTKPFMPKIVKAFKNTKKQEAIEILWYCAQNLSYPEFYSAWHS
jgi:HEAT repeat protein